MYNLTVGGLAIRGESDVLLSLYRLIYRTQDVSMRICKVEDCEKSFYGAGYCRLHYIRFKKYGDPLFTKTEKHGMIKTSEYKTWGSIKDRCCNKNCKDYKNYGGRGITVCDRWWNSFTAFLEDMGKRPFPKAQIDRIDNDGNYEPGNCRWITCKENIRNASWIKLSMNKVKEIRKIYKTGGISQRVLGSIYGVRQENISLIVNNKRWA